MIKQNTPDFIATNFLWICMFCHVFSTNFDKYFTCISGCVQLYRWYLYFRQKGSDASRFFGNEVAQNEQEDFSDDEEEARAKIKAERQVGANTFKSSLPLLFIKCTVTFLLRYYRMFAKLVFLCTQRRDVKYSTLLCSVFHNYSTAIP